MLMTEHGDSEARWSLVLSILPWTYKIVAKHWDMETMADIALDTAMLAVDKFNPQRGRLITIAWYCMSSVIRRRYAKRVAWWSRVQSLSLDKMTVLDTHAFTGEEAAIRAEQRELVKHLIRQLPRRDQAILRRRLRGDSFIRISQIWGIHPEWARQVARSAAKKVGLNNV